MPEFPKPKFEFRYEVDAEIGRLRQWRKKVDRFIPAKSNETLLLATWNIANFGAHDRRDQDHRLIAEILGWFDVIAIQETRSNLSDLDAVAALLPRHRRLFTDTAGNDERMVYLYDAKKGIAVREQVGEVAIEPSELRHIKLPGVTQSFNGFDRNPFLASFQFKNARLTLANVHLYFGRHFGSGPPAPATGDVRGGPLGAARINRRPPTTRRSFCWAISTFRTWRTTIRFSRC